LIYECPLHTPLIPLEEIEEEEELKGPYQQ